MNALENIRRNVFGLTQPVATRERSMTFLPLDSQGYDHSACGHIPACRRGGGHMPVVGQNAVGVFARMLRCTFLQSTGRVRVAALPAFFTSFHSMTMTVMDALRGVSPALLGAPIQTAVGRADGPNLETRQDGTANAILTPECERLQGFPDGWTQVPYRNKPAADGPRYKALGNSMAVNVMRVIGSRIAMVEAA